MTSELPGQVVLCSRQTRGEHWRSSQGSLPSSITKTWPTPANRAIAKTIIHRFVAIFLVLEEELLGKI